MALIIFLGPFVLAIFAGLIKYAISGDTLPDNSVNTIANCSQAHSQWEAALDARDAITPQEAMTSSGRAKWQELRDRANELQQVKNNLCN